MDDFTGTIPHGENRPYNPKWEKACKVSNIILSILYFFTWEFFGFFGFLTLVIGNSVWVWIGLAFSFLVVPLSCIFSIYFSIKLRKKQKYTEAYLIQFIPFAEFGLSLFLAVSYWLFTMMFC